MESNFLALNRYLRKYSEKTKKSAARGFSFASNRKSLPISVLKLKGHIIQATMYLLLSGRPLWVIFGNFHFLEPRLQRVTDSSQAVIYLFSRLRSNLRIPCIQCERVTLPILKHIPQTFLLLPVFRPVLPKGAQQGKNSVTLINVAINLVVNIFVSEFIFPKFLLSKLFSNIFFSKFFFQSFVSTFFLKIFFPTFFQNFFFLRALLSMPPRLQSQNGLYVSML